MSDELRVGISAGVGFLILLSGYIFSFFDVKFGKAKFIDRAKAKGNYTEGYIIDGKLSFGDRTSNNQNIRANTMHVTYEYIVNGIKYKKKLSFQSPGRVTVQYPVKVVVYYDEHNPKKSVCPGEASRIAQQRRGCLFTIVMTVVVVAFLLNVLKLFVR